MTVTVEAQLLNQKLSLKVREDEEERLRIALVKLNFKLNEMKSKSGIVSTERIALLAALSFAVEAIDAGETKRPEMLLKIPGVREALDGLNGELDAALSPQKPLL